MARFSTLALVIVLLTSVPQARGQGADEVKRLKEQIELLEGKLKNAEKENELLKKEVELLKVSGGKGELAKPEKARTLDDLLTEGTTIRGDYTFLTGNKAQGDWTLTIKERVGEKFKGSYTAKETKPNKGESVEVDAEGKIVGNRITFSPVNTTKMEATATGTLKKDAIELDWAGRGGKAKMTAKAPK